MDGLVSEARFDAAAWVPAKAFDDRPAGVDAEEWRLRVELAACYRIVDRIGWTELIYNHITTRLPGTGDRFLTNPYGLRYDEVRASTLVCVDLAGNIVGESDWPANPAGFTIHSAIHDAVANARCILHTHTTAGVAVSAQVGGLRMESIYASLLYGHVAYHDFEGVTVREDEKERLVASLGDRKHLILRNHGLLTVGETIAEAFLRMWHLNRACEVQVAANAGGAPVIAVSEDACAASAAAWAGYDQQEPHGARAFSAFWRQIDGEDPSYRT